MRSSEQGSGWLALFVLAYAMQPVAAEMVRESLEPVERCRTVTTFEYKGRDDEGRPVWSYPEIEVCYER